MARVPELKTLNYIAKRVLKKDLIRKIKRVEDKEEQVRLFEYSIKSVLELRYAELKERAEKIGKEKGDSFISMTKISLLGSKVRYILATFDKEEFKKFFILMKKTEKEIKK